jgi:hypothetical protein
MRRQSRWWSLLLGVLYCAWTSPAWSADRVRVIVANSERGTSAQIVRDIAKHIARPAAIEFDPRQASSPADVLRRLQEGDEQKFAVLPADVAEAYIGAAVRGSIEAGELLAPVRVMAPLHEDDIYFIVRSDSPLNFVHEIEISRINFGPLQGNTPLTVATLYRLMFSAAVPDRQASFHAYNDALAKLTENALDVVVVVASPPVRLLTEMKPEARRFVKLLKFDPTHPVAAAALKVYSTTTVPAASYPNLLDEDLPVLAIKMYFVSHGRNDALQARFAKAWCQNLPRLRAAGHPNLGKLELGLPQLVKGWHYSTPFERELRACGEGMRSVAEACSREDHALGLCG